MCRAGRKGRSYLWGDWKLRRFRVELDPERSRDLQHCSETRISLYGEVFVFVDFFAVVLRIALLLLKVLGQGDCFRDVLLLGGFVPASEKEKKSCPPLRAVDAISRSDVYIRLGHAIGQVAEVPRISQDFHE